jgi:ABC-type branched-subunit amino acid transport system ATPase component
MTAASRRADFPTARPRSRHPRLFALFPPLEERRNHLGNKLSGEQQMLTVAAP